MPSSHFALFGVYTHTPATQVSFVQSTLSLQTQSEQLQFSQLTSQIPSPQVDTHKPASQLSAQL